MFVVPVPGLGVDWLPNTSQYTNGAEIVALDMVCTKPTKKTDGRRSGVELGNFVLLHGLPVTRGSGVYGSGLEHSCRDTIGKWSVNNICVTSDPTNVSHASKLVIWVNIEDVFDGQSGTKQVPGCGMKDSLGSAG